MGTKVHRKSHTPEFYSTRDMNEDSNSSSWSPFYGDKHFTSGPYYNGFVQRKISDGCPGYEKDVLKQKILEHETVFKNQVCELHRVYRVQRDIMEEVKRKELYKHHRSIDTSSSSSFFPSQIPSNDVKNMQAPSFPLANPGYIRPTILGSEVIDSPSSCTKGNNSQADLIPYQNRRKSKDCAFLDSRPSKVRKKLFGFQIPVDEYIDTEEEEQCQETKASNALNYSPNGNHGLPPKNSVNLFLGGGKTDGLGDTSSNSCLKVPHRLADLNEPIQIEEDNSPEFGDVPRHSTCSGEIRGLDLSARPKPQFVDLSEDHLQNSQRGSNNGNYNNLSETNKGTGRGWLSYMYEAGTYGVDANFNPKLNQSEQLPTASQQTPFMAYQPNQQHRILPSSSKKEPWTEGNHSYDFSNRSHGHSNCHLPDSVVTSHTSNPYPLYNSSGVASSWSHSVPSWGKPDPSLSRKLTTLHTWPSVISSETSSRSSRQTAQTPEIFRDKRHVNDSSSWNPGGSNFHTQDGFFYGSPLSSRRLLSNLSTTGYNNLNCSESDVVAADHLRNHGSGNALKFSNVIDLTSGKDLDLNVVLPNDSLHEAPPARGRETLDGVRKFEYHSTALPWLREKPVCKDVSTITKKGLNLVELGIMQASRNLRPKDETVKDPHPLFIQNVSAASSGCDVGVKRDSDCLSNGKILGIPIFGKLCTPKNDSASSSTSIHNPSKGSDTKDYWKHRGIDINVACDLMDTGSEHQIAAEAIVAESGKDTKCRFRNIDLNSYVSDDEDLVAPSLASTSGKTKIALGIDLEAPIILENVEATSPREVCKQHETPLQSPHCRTEQQEDQVVRIAAEAIVVISSYNQDYHTECTHLDRSESSVADSLLWFADAISSSTEDLEKKLCRNYEGKNGKEIGTNMELDDYEAMTLQLPETLEEDYMPKPFIPEIHDLEEVGATSLPSRTRKGPARRGRMKRDFQRDILPGLISLSRHEVTEDLQTFGGLMRATGHQWNGGMTRRNGTRSGAARGRRRCVVGPSPTVVVTPVCNPLVLQFNSVEVGPEERSLTGWGKTTRRPRRQRCAAGNNFAVAIT